MRLIYFRRLSEVSESELIVQLAGCDVYTICLNYVLVLMYTNITIVNH